MVSDWLIRPLSPDDDLGELTDLIHAAYAAHLSEGLRFVGAHQTIKVTGERLASGHAFVMTSNRKLIGTVTVRPPKLKSSVPLYRDPRTWSISQLAVAPNWKGRGLGQVLHDDAIRFAVQHGGKTMALDTAEPARRLISLYESWGYRIVGRVDWRPQTNYESVLMSRAIAS